MRLLLAEDEISLAKALSVILQKNNYTVDVVYDGEEALDYLNTNIYDAAVIDIMMPKLDGISLLKTIRQNNNKIPVLLLTAKAEVADKVLGLDSGANDYLTKPFATSELLARLRAMLRNYATQTDTNIVVGNITLDTVSYQLSSPTMAYRLTSKEYQIMELLMRNPKSVISSNQFFCKIWGYDSDVDLGVVWVYIAYLRKKLDALQAKVKIKAIRNIGYTLEVTQ